jgi:hypothetical protein
MTSDSLASLSNLMGKGNEAELVETSKKMLYLA